MKSTKPKVITNLPSAILSKESDACFICEKQIPEKTEYISFVRNIKKNKGEKAITI